MSLLSPCVQEQPAVSLQRGSRAGAWPVMAVGLLAALVFFYRLGTLPLNDWDEAWHAQVASEIITTGDWATLHCRGDYYFNKPPLTFWLKAIAFKAGGINEATTRFFPALFGWGSVVAATWFFARLFGNWVGFIGGLILSTSWLATVHHTGRSGEADSTLIFFLTLTIIFLWLARTNPRWCYAAGVATALGWLSKGATAYLPWVACLLAALIERPKTGWRWRHAFGGLLLGVVLTTPWQAFMIARYGRAFVNVFYIGEGSGPLLNAVEDHPGSPFFYVMVLHEYFQPWLVLAAAAVAAMACRTRDPRWPAILWLATWGIAALAGCSLFATKMVWYAAPALPAVAGLAAFGLVELYRRRFGVVLILVICGLGVIQAKKQYWAKLDQGAALAMVGLAVYVLASARSFADPRKRRWALAMASAAMGIVFGQGLFYTYQFVGTWEDPTGGMELRMLDEPWRELTAKLATDPVTREYAKNLVLVDLPVEPASYFYLNQLTFPNRFTSLTGDRVEQSLQIKQGSLVITRIEQVDSLLAKGLREVMRAESIVVMRLVASHNKVASEGSQQY